MTRQFVEVQQNIRPKIEALVELLVDILDQLDGDTDREDDTPLEIDADFEPDADGREFRLLRFPGGNGRARLRQLELID